MSKEAMKPYRQLQDNGSKYFGESWDKAEQPAQQALDKMADNAKELGLDYEPATYTFKQSSELMIATFDMKPNHNMTFHNQDGKHVGTLDFNGPEMTFTGDANKSAKVFFDFIARSFRARLEQERADMKEKCAKVCDQLAIEDGLHQAKYCANAIRGRMDE